MKLVGVWVASCGELAGLETHELGYAGLDQPSSYQQPFLGGTSDVVAMRAEKERIVTVGDEVWEDEASERVLRNIFVSRGGRHVERSRMGEKTTGVPGYMMESRTMKETNGETCLIYTFVRTLSPVDVGIARGKSNKLGVLPSCHDGRQTS